MARPTTKDDLLVQANNEFDKLLLVLNNSSIDILEKNFEFDTTNLKEKHWNRDLNVKDVLIHLYEWHQLLIDWIKNNDENSNISFLPAPYNWKTYGNLNVTFVTNHQDTSYDDAKKKLMKSHKDVIEIISKFTNDELFSKGVYKWTGTSTLGSYCVSSTFSHYTWALKKIKKHLS